MDRRYYPSYSSSGSKYSSKSQYGSRAKSRSPTRDRKRSRDNMRDIDFEAKRKEIDLEMQRQDAERKRRESTQRNDRKSSEHRAQNETVAPTNTLVQQTMPKEDLRNMIERRSLTPPPVPPPMQNVGINAVSSVSLSSDSSVVYSQSYSHSLPVATQQIPGFDYGRLGSLPESATTSDNMPFNEPLPGAKELTDKSREARLDDFTKDCDLVAVVTQMLLEEDPSLEGPLVKAMQGVLQKIMQKHLEVFPR